MEIDITKFVQTYGDDMARFSDSVANSGLDNIGAITWRNALKAMENLDAHLVTDLDALRAHFAGYGAWSRDELAEMDGNELNALLIQFIASDYQKRERAKERGELDEWEANFGGRLFCSHESTSEGRWFYCIGE